MTESNLRHRMIAVPRDVLTIGRPEGVIGIDEVHQESWSRAVIVEMLLGRKLLPRVGIKGGVVFYIGRDSLSPFQSSSRRPMISTVASAPSTLIKERLAEPWFSMEGNPSNSTNRSPSA